MFAGLILFSRSWKNVKKREKNVKNVVAENVKKREKTWKNVKSLVAKREKMWKTNREIVVAEKREKNVKKTWKKRENFDGKNVSGISKVWFRSSGKQLSGQGAVPSYLFEFSWLFLRHSPKARFGENFLWWTCNVMPLHPLFLWRVLFLVSTLSLNSSPFFSFFASLVLLISYLISYPLWLSPCADLRAHLATSAACQKEGVNDSYRAFRGVFSSSPFPCLSQKRLRETWKKREKNVKKREKTWKILAEKNVKKGKALCIGSSAGIEKQFSTLKITYGQLRTRLGVEKAGKLGFTFRALNTEKWTFAVQCCI